MTLDEKIKAEYTKGQQLSEKYFAETKKIYEEKYKPEHDKIKKNLEQLHEEWRKQNKKDNTQCTKKEEEN